MTLYLLSTDPDVALTFNGKKWSAPDTIDAGTIEPLDAISCPSATFCTAVDGWGQAFDPDVQKGYGLTGISCPNAAPVPGRRLGGQRTHRQGLRISARS